MNKGFQLPLVTLVVSVGQFEFEFEFKFKCIVPAVSKARM